MRSPRRREVEGRCRQALPALCEKHEVGFVDAIEVDRTGWVNLCFFVGEALVVRFNARDPHLPKFRREQVAYELLAKRGAPVPRVLALDEDRDLVPFDVLITQRLPGRNLESDWETLAPDHRRELVLQAAHWLDMLHEVAFPGFGETARGTPHVTWSGAVRAQMDVHLEEAAQFDSLRASDIARFQEMFSDHVTSLLDEIVTPTLVHADYHPGNLLYQRDRIAGLLDFEWSFAGDPLFDLSYQQNLDGMGFPDTFIEAFAPMLNEGDLRRQQLYKCMRNVELCNVARQHFETGEADDYRRATLEHLTWLEAVWS